MDYGHELAVGTFLTPQNRRPQGVVALAWLTEEVGSSIRPRSQCVPSKTPRPYRISRRR